MKILLTIIVVSMLFAGVLAAAGAEGVIDLSTLGKTTTTVSGPATHLGENATPQVLDLSTLGKANSGSTTPPVMIKGPAPITITPMFSIMNPNTTTPSEANTVFTLPQAVAANATVYTPPIAIFGGA